MQLGNEGAKLGNENNQKAESIVIAMSHSPMSSQPTTEASDARPKLSIIVPMYNEEENAPITIRRIAEVIEPLRITWELILVDDGSTDKTREVLERLSATHEYVRFLSYRPNKGRGRALRTGFGAARGDYIIATDADLTYDPNYMLEMIRVLDAREADLVLASPYMPGGASEGVPFSRLFVSKVGNRILSATLPVKIYTITCVFRAYRREVLEQMELESNGKEIHLEILSKALALGWEVKEIPAVLTSRKYGSSTFRFRRTAITHLLFSFIEQPMLLFGLLGLAMVMGGFAIGIYMFYLYLGAQLNPSRPFMTLMTVLITSGLFMFSFGLVAINISLIRKEIFRLQKQNLEIIRRVKKVEGSLSDRGQER